MHTFALIDLLGSDAGLAGRARNAVNSMGEKQLYATATKVLCTTLWSVLASQEKIAGIPIIDQRAIFGFISQREAFFMCKHENDSKTQRQLQ